MSPSVHSVEFRDVYLSMQVVLLVAMRHTMGPLVWPEKLYNTEIPRTLLMGIVVVSANGSCTKPELLQDNQKGTLPYSVNLQQYNIMLIYHFFLKNRLT